MKKYLYLIPSILGVFIFFLIPIMNTVYSSLTLNGEYTITLENYRQVMMNNSFKLALFNTIRLIIICIPILFLVSLIISYYIHSANNAVMIFIKNIYLIPYVMPVTTLIVVWKSIFSNVGLLNKLLDNQSINWIESKYSFYIVVITFIWKNLGYSSIIWLAGLNSIPYSTYEAAEIDGANNFNKFLYITVPSLYKTSILVTILSLINILKVFREIYLIGGDYPDRKIYMLQHLFNNWFRDLNLGNLYSGGIIVGVLIICITSLLLMLLYRGEKN